MIFGPIIMLAFIALTVMVVAWVLRAAGLGWRPRDEGKSALDPTITRKLMSNIFKGSEKKTIEPLTDRELDVLHLAAKGYTNKAIGVQLTISDRTVQGHLAHIFSKLQAGSRTEAVMRAVSLGLISQSTGDISEE